MAASAIPAPGTKYGPCADECEHRDCAANRKMAGCICRICQEPIGYDRRAFDEWYDKGNDDMRVRYDFFVHEICYLQEVGRA